ncbi:MAG: glycosyltransferase family 2 protein [Gallionellaceae bacterium]
MTQKISIILPFFNEENNVPIFFARLQDALKTLQDFEFEWICINDGSQDETLASLKRAQAMYTGLVIIDFTRNFGKEAALTAGLDHATGDALIFMDTDLQHPPEIIPSLIDCWREKGKPVILARRRSRTTEGALYRIAAKYFYRLHNSISEVQIPPDIGDFRLIGRSVAEQVKRLPESRRFMKGLFAWVGYESAIVDYDVAPRFHGRTSFNKWRSWNFALEGITSFSTVPLRLWTYIGLFFTCLGFLYASWIVIRTLVVGVDTPGYASLLTAVVFLGGLQLIGIGIMGEYIGRIHLESKRRPVYLVRQILTGINTSNKDAQ